MIPDGQVMDATQNALGTGKLPQTQSQAVLVVWGHVEHACATTKVGFGVLFVIVQVVPVTETVLKTSLMEVRMHQTQHRASVTTMARLQDWSGC